MGSHKVGETGCSNLRPSNLHHHHIPYAVLHGLPPPSANFINHQEGSAFDFGELEEAIVLQNLKLNHDDSKLSFYTSKPAATLEMFPSWPMRPQQTPKGSSKSGGESNDSGSAVNTLSSGGRLEPESPVSRIASSDHQQAFDHNHIQFPQDQNQLHQQQLQVVEMASDSPISSSGPSQTQPPSNHSLEKRRGPGATSDRVLDAKTLQRLAQNREAARKSRLRKKAYVQQLESGRIRLSQLEQDLHRARSQGLFLGGGDGGNAGGIMSSAHYLIFPHFISYSHISLYRKKF
ncbi:transcription factor TGA9-like [Apium graveolens]|uniref:transcription factor TGA9-like n=1 Tax=Apium graveolens TaxID=4045 RepID=UPI003D78D13B